MLTYKQAIKNRLLDELLNSWGLEKLPPNVQFVVYLRDENGRPFVITPPRRTSVLIMKRPEVGSAEVFQVQLIGQCLNGTVLEITLEGDEILELLSEEIKRIQIMLERKDEEYLEALTKLDENRT